MVVILFHDNDDILFQKYQKDFISKNQSSENIIYAHYPIRCPLSNENLTKSELKEIVKSLESVTLNGVTWDEESQTLNCNITLNYHNNTNTSFTFPLVHSLHKQKKIAENDLIFPAISLLPKTIKTFRVGNEVILDSISSSVTDFVWH